MPGTLDHTAYVNGIECRVHRLAWTPQQRRLVLGSFVGTRTQVTALSAAVMKQRPRSISIARNGIEIVSIDRMPMTEDNGIRYRRIVEPTSKAGLYQCVIWSNLIEHDHRSPKTTATMAVGRTRAELEHAAYLHVNRRTRVPMREEWISRIIAEMIDQRYAEDLKAINCYGVHISRNNDRWLEAQIADILRPAA